MKLELFGGLAGFEKWMSQNTDSRCSVEVGVVFVTKYI